MKEQTKEIRVNHNKPPKYPSTRVIKHGKCPGDKEVIGFGVT